MHRLALRSGEAYHGAGVRSLGRQNAFGELAVSKGRLVCERLVELDNEAVAEILRHSAPVHGRITHDLAVGDNLDARAAGHRVDDHESAVGLGESETEDGRPLGRSYLASDIMLCQINAVIIWLGYLALVREPACALILVEGRSSGHRHNCELAVVSDPRAGLVSLLEAADLVVGIDIRPAVACAAGLGSPEVHAPWQGDGGISVAG